MKSVLHIDNITVVTEILKCLQIFHYHGLEFVLLITLNLARIYIVSAHFHTLSQIIFSSINIIIYINMIVPFIEKMAL